MRTVSDTAWMQSQVVPVSRSPTPDRQADFAAYMRQKSQRAAQSADKPSTDQSSSATQATDGSNNQADNSNSSTSDNTTPGSDSSLQWLAAQLLAFKVKQPEQTVNADGSMETSIKTSIVTLPVSAMAAGQVPSAPGIEGGITDPKALLGLMDQTPAAPDGAPVTEPTLPEIPATPVATLPPPDVTTPVATVIDPSVTGATDPTKIESPDVSTPPPVDPTLVAEQPATTAPVDPDTVVSATSPDDGSADRQPTATAGTSDATATGARYAVGHAGAASGGSAGSGFSDGSGSNSKGDDKSSDPSVNSVQAQPALPSMTAATQVHIAVPAEHQLAPSIGIEIATTAQGMSAVERVQQATDQAQVPTSMLKVLNVQLAPPDLGNVSVRLSLEGSAIDVHMTADQSRTRTLIERDRHVIADSLTKVGYSVNTLTIDQTSATSDSNMSSAGQSFSSNNSFDGSSGRQSNGAGEFGRPQREAGRNGGFMDADGSIPAAPPRRPGASRGVFV